MLVGRRSTVGWHRRANQFLDFFEQVSRHVSEDLRSIARLSVELPKHPLRIGFALVGTDGPLINRGKCLILSA